jgi:hypothetical protein
VLSSATLKSQLTQSELSLQPVKLLSQRDDYTTCHVFIPEVGVPAGGHRSPAIVLDGGFYSFFRSANDPVKIFSLLQKLSANGELAVMTPTPKGYAIWVSEPDAQLVAPKGQPPKTLPPSFGPAICWIINDRQPGYRTCTLKVPDLPDTVPGLAEGQKLFSLYRRETEAETALKLGSRLSQRGDEIVIVAAQQEYAICIYEPGATIAD